MPNPLNNYAPYAMDNNALNMGGGDQAFAQYLSPRPWGEPTGTGRPNQGTIVDSSRWGPVIAGYQKAIQDAHDRLKQTGSDEDFRAYQRAVVNFWNAVNHGEYMRTPGGETIAQFGGIDPGLRAAISQGNLHPEGYGWLLNYPPMFFARHPNAESLSRGPLSAPPQYYSVPAGSDPNAILPPG